MLKAVAFDWGHTLMDELAHRDIPLKSRPVVLMPGARTCLARIPLPMAVWANTRRVGQAGVRGWLRRAGLDGGFRWVVTSVEAGCRKPDPRFFGFALRKCGLSRDEVLFVGNQLDTDIRGAERAGLRSVWLSGRTFRSPDDTLRPGEARPTHKIRSLDELPDLVEALIRA